MTLFAGASTQGLGGDAERRDEREALVHVFLLEAEGLFDAHPVHGDETHAVHQAEALEPQIHPHLVRLVVKVLVDPAYVHHPQNVPAAAAGKKIIA